MKSGETKKKVLYEEFIEQKKWRNQEKSAVRRVHRT